MTSRGRKTARWAVLSVVGGMALVGVLHLPAARPILRLARSLCPVRDVSAAEVESARSPALRALRGRAPAPRRPALGFVLGVTRQEEAEKWASGRGVSCRLSTRGLGYLGCTNVPPDALGLSPDEGAVADLVLAFDGRGRLIGVDALRRGLPADRAAGAGAAIERRLRPDIGVPSEAAGEWSSAYLGAGPMRTRQVRYRFLDYAAVVTATFVPEAGVILREQYLSLIELVH